MAPTGTDPAREVRSSEANLCYAARGAEWWLLTLAGSDRRAATSAAMRAGRMAVEGRSSFALDWRGAVEGLTRTGRPPM